MFQCLRMGQLRNTIIYVWKSTMSSYHCRQNWKWSQMVQGAAKTHLGEPIEYQLNTWASQSNTNGIMGAPSQCQSNTWARQSNIFIPGLLLLQNAGLQGLRVPKLEGFKIAGLAPVSSSAGSQILGLQRQKISLVNLVILNTFVIINFYTIFFNNYWTFV